MRSAFARMFYKMINCVSDTEVVDDARDFRMMTRKMTDAVLSLSAVDRFSKELFSWVGFKTKWLEYENVGRIKGTTKWSFKKLFKYAVGGIENASNMPLRINMIFCVLFALLCFAFIVVDIVFAGLGKPVTTLLGLLPILFFMCSAIFLGLHFLGDYIYKIFIQVRGRPLYIIKETDDIDRDQNNK